MARYLFFPVLPVPTAKLARQGIHVAGKILRYLRVFRRLSFRFPPRTDKGAAFISGLAVDTLNEFIYVA